jgi:DNA-binding NtrC family response regulator
MRFRRICLIVDDESSVRRLLKSILESHGYQVLEALNAIQALHLTGKLGDAVDLIVSDINMPDGDDLMFVWSVSQSYPAIPIVLILGKAHCDQLHNPRSVFEFVQKPFTSDALLDAIERAVKTTEAKIQDSGSGDR